MRKLTLKKMLEFYDVPQLFIASDTMNSNYLCLLYDRNEGYDYLAVQISDLRLKSFMSGEIDLRKIYQSPEQDDSLYHVTVSNKSIEANRLLQTSEISEEMLPDPGYYYEADDAIEENTTDSIQIDIPIKDRGFLSEIANRMGWSTKLISEASKHIAVL